MGGRPDLAVCGPLAWRLVVYQLQLGHCKCEFQLQEAGRESAGGKPRSIPVLPSGGHLTSSPALLVKAESHG